MLLILDTGNVSFIPPVDSGGQVSSLSQSEESRAPARRGNVEGAQAATGNEAFELIIVLMKKETLIKGVSSERKTVSTKMQNPHMHTMSAN